MGVPVRFEVETARITRHAADVASYEFRYLDKRPRYKPGQFLHLALDAYDPTGHWPESRALTIANGASNREFVRLTIAAKGRFTRRILDELSIGRRVWLKGPYGEFIVRADAGHEVVLVAGGTGVTPFVAFMEDALQGETLGDIWLHYGARSPDLLVFRGLAERCAAAGNFRVRYYAENGAAEGIVPGRIDVDAACRMLKAPASATYYLCGPQPMVDACAARLQSAYGVPPAGIRVDQWE